MRALISTILGVFLLANTGFSQNEASYIGKATGAAAQCIAGEKNVIVSVDDMCDNGGTLLITFNQTWSPPFCPPGQTCPVPIPPPWDYEIIARVTIDCNNGAVIDVNCDRIPVFGPVPRQTRFIPLIGFTTIPRQPN